jgi:hypothetical protein
MSEFTATATAEAMLALANQVEKLTAEMMALKLFVAGIPGATMHPQAIRNALKRQTQQPHQSQAIQKRLEDAQKVIDELSGYAGEFAAQNR